MTAASGRAARRKGVAGEREVAQRFEAAGWTVRGLKGSGDHLAILHRPVFKTDYFDATLHLEIKRQERLRLPEWIERPTEARPASPGCSPSGRAAASGSRRWRWTIF